MANIKDKKYEEESNQILNEVNQANPTLNENLSWSGKIFFSGIALYLFGSALEKYAKSKNAIRTPFKVKGTPQQLQALANIIASSKAFKDELDKPGANIESVMKKLNLRNIDKETFERITGKKFPL